MPGVNVGWDETDPANSKNLGLGANDIRSMKTSVRNAMSAEHVFTSTGGADTGQHQLGSARCYVGASSTLSSDGTTGRLYFNTTNSQFYYLSATSSNQIGGRGTAYVGDADVTFGTTGHRTNIYVGLTKTDSLGASVITFNSVYSGAPYVLLTAFSPNNVNACIATISATSAAVFTYNTSGTSASGCSVFWQSTGSGHHLQTMA